MEKVNVVVHAARNVKIFTIGSKRNTGKGVRNLQYLTNSRRAPGYVIDKHVLIRCTGYRLAIWTVQPVEAARKNQQRPSIRTHRRADGLAGDVIGKVL